MEELFGSDSENSDGETKIGVPHQEYLPSTQQHMEELFGDSDDDHASNEGTVNSPSYEQPVENEQWSSADNGETEINKSINDEDGDSGGGGSPNQSDNEPEVRFDSDEDKFNDSDNGGIESEIPLEASVDDGIAGKDQSDDESQFQSGNINDDDKIYRQGSSDDGDENFVLNQNDEIEERQEQSDFDNIPPQGDDADNMLHQYQSDNESTTFTQRQSIDGVNDEQHKIDNSPTNEIDEDDIGRHNDSSGQADSESDINLRTNESDDDNGLDNVATHTKESDDEVDDEENKRNKSGERQIVSDDANDSESSPSDIEEGKDNKGTSALNRRLDNVSDEDNNEKQDILRNQEKDNIDSDSEPKVYKNRILSEDESEGEEKETHRGVGRAEDDETQKVDSDNNEGDDFFKELENLEDGNESDEKNEEPSKDVSDDENEDEKDDEDVMVPTTQDLFGEEVDVSSDEDEDKESQVVKKPMIEEESDEEQTEQRHHINEHPPSPEKEDEGLSISIELPRCNISLGKELYFIKLPNFLSVDTKPFDPIYYEDEIDEDEVLDEEGRKRLKLKVENTIRWRYSKDKDGNEIKESNCRFVRWSDGSLTMHLGNEVFDVFKMPIEGEQNHLFVQQGTGLQAQAVFKNKLSFRPQSTLSQTHQKMILSIADRMSKAQKIKMVPATELDPESQRDSMLKKEDERLRAQTRRENQQRKIREKNSMKALNSNYLEQDMDDEVDLDESLAAIKNRFREDIKGGRSSRASIDDIYSEDDSDSEAENKLKNAKLDIDSDDEKTVHEPKKKKKKIIEESDDEESD